jgi:hypothetical protein
LWIIILKKNDDGVVLVDKPIKTVDNVDKLDDICGYCGKVKIKW